MTGDSAPSTENQQETPQESNGPANSGDANNPRPQRPNRGGYFGGGRGGRGRKFDRNSQERPKPRMRPNPQKKIENDGDAPHNLSGGGGGGGGSGGGGGGGGGGSGNFQGGGGGGGGNFQGGGRGRGGGGRGPRGPRSDRADTARGDSGSFINERLLKSITGPTTDIPPQELTEKKFNSRCRLYVGNLPADLNEEQFKKLFDPYGETNEFYINKEKMFSFVRLDYRSTAEKAKRELDGQMFNGRPLRVRFAPIGATVKVKNLTSFVTNELLEMAFAVFGEVERALVYVDDRGNSLKEGIVEFCRKTSAQSALRHCNECCFFLTNSLRPVIVEAYEPNEDIDGYTEKAIIKKTQDYYDDRSVGPRFAKPGSFEHEFGTRWKQIYELHRQKEEALKRELKLEEDKLEAQLQYAKYEHETEVLREQLRQREQDRERQKREWEMKERLAEEQRMVEEESLRRQQEDLSRRMLHQEDELRRRQHENSLFMQETSNGRNVGGGGGSQSFGHNDHIRPSTQPYEKNMNDGGMAGDGDYMEQQRGGFGRGGGGRPGNGLFDRPLEGMRRGQPGIAATGGGAHKPDSARWAERRPAAADTQSSGFPNKRRRF